MLFTLSLLFTISLPPLSAVLNVQNGCVTFQEYETCRVAASLLHSKNQNYHIDVQEDDAIFLLFDTTNHDNSYEKFCEKLRASSQYLTQKSFHIALTTVFDETKQKATFIWFRDGEIYCASNSSSSGWVVQFNDFSYSLDQGNDNHLKVYYFSETPIDNHMRFFLMDKPFINALNNDSERTEQVWGGDALHWPFEYSESGAALNSEACCSVVRGMRNYLQQKEEDDLDGTLVFINMKG